MLTAKSWKKVCKIVKPVIAIDGPSGSGKGTLALKLADHFGFAYLDTGVLYRTIAYQKMTLSEISSLTIHDVIESAQKIPSDTLRSNSVSTESSEIAKNASVRKIMMQLQRDFIASPGDQYDGSVLDGRDIGTVVAPDAFCKLFITASLDVRAMRRFASIKQNNASITYEEIYDSMQKRDLNDQARSIAPLQCCDDYIVVDTSCDTEEESFYKLVTIVANRLH